jgi:hypothetical protein
MGEQSKMEVTGARIFVLNGIPYLPHYSEPNRYVGPGYGRDNHTTYNALELVAMGAKPDIEALWPRGWHKGGK